MAEHALISLNILKNALINCSDYTKTLNMPDHFLCFIGFWRCLCFWICQGCEYDMFVYVRVTQSSEYVCMAQYCSIMPEHALVYPSGIKFSRVLNMLWYSCKKIIIVTNVILQFLSAWFVHPGFLQPRGEYRPFFRSVTAFGVANTLG